MLAGIKTTRIPFAAIILALAFGGMSCTAKAEPPPPFQDGTVDMKMFDTGTPVALDGAWEFYWNRFIDPASFADDGQPLPDALATFPAVWNDYGLEGVGQTGFATWRLRLAGLAEGRAYGLQSSSFISAVAVYVNGELVQSHGWPGRSDQDEAPGWDSIVSPVFANPAGIADIVIHASNWSDGKGGTRSSVIFGDYDDVVTAHARAVAYDVFIAAMVAALGAAYIGLFATRRASAAALWFGLLCAVLALHTLCQGEYFVMSIDPGMEWRVLFDLRHLTIALALVLAAALVGAAIPGKFPSAIVIFVTAVSICYSAFVILAPSRQASLVFPWYQVASLLAGLAMIISIVTAIVRKRAGAWLLFIAAVAVFSAAVHDVLVYNGLVGGAMITRTGLPLFLYGLSLAVARGMSTSSGALSNADAVHASSGLPAEQRASERLVPSEILPYLKRERIEDVALGDAAARTMAVMSVTILESSRMPELSTPAAVFAFINEFLDRVVPAVEAADGFVYRYEGYGFTMLFHNGAESALRCALDMQSRIEAYNTERENRGRKTVGIAVGFHSGELALGTVGEGRRMDVAIVSGDFELGSRLVNLAVEYGLGIAASERFMSELRDPASCRSRMVGRMRGAEKEKPVAVFEIYDDDPEELGARKDAAKAVFERAVGSWHARRFDEARTLFREVLAKVPQDGASLKYMALLGARSPRRASSAPAP
jgi:class 3 adenylate cyclase